MQNLIDLCTPEKDSKAVCRPTQKSPTKSHAMSRVQSYIQTGILRRQSERIKKLQAQKLAAAKANMAAPQKTPKKKTPPKKKVKQVSNVRKKKISSNRKCEIKEEHTPKRQKTSAILSYAAEKQVPIKLSTPIATAIPLATATTTPLVTATATATMTTPVATATFQIPLMSGAPVPASVPVVNAHYANSPSFAPDTDFCRFQRRLTSLRERIALNPENHSLDVSQCVCQCPYSTGLLSEQRFMLMRRAFQINYLLLSNPHLRDEWC